MEQQTASTTYSLNEDDFKRFEFKTIDEKILVRLNELSKTVSLKGFRPGKVPVNVLKRQFGKAVYGEVLEKILKETSAKALEEKKIKVAKKYRRSKSREKR